MLLIATDLNGHLRVHPKRVAFMPHPNYLAPKESSSTRPTHRLRTRPSGTTGWESQSDAFEASHHPFGIGTLS